MVLLGALAQESGAPEGDAGAGDNSALVAARRAGPAILVHRGATAFAPENTLKAFTLAMDLGADGVEMDVRRTRDGVLVLFHDESVDRLLRGVGRVRGHTLAQLRALRPVTWRGRPLGGWVPTFEEFLQAARARGMLIHLDLKEAGLETEVARRLTETGTWPQVVWINPANAETLRQDPRYRPLHYKAPGLYVGRQDVDPAAVEAALARPGELLLVNDPRVAAQILGRAPASRWLRIERRLRVSALAATAGRSPRFPADVVERLNGLRPRPDVARLLTLLAGTETAPPDLDATGRMALLTTRAWAVGALGEAGEDTRRVRRALERVIDHPLAIDDTELNGLDTALAIRALGELHATAAAGHLVRFFQAGATGPAESSDNAALWRRWRPRMYVLGALGEMPCRTARRFLEDYVALSPEAARRYGPPVVEEATRSLLQQRLDWAGIAKLLQHPNGAVRGTAILECLDHPTEERRLALRRAAPWALELRRLPRFP